MKFPFDPLPEGFVLGKPLDQERYEESVIYALERRGNLIITRKRDGWKLLFARNKNKIKIYTAGGNEVDGRLDHLRDEIEKLGLVPNGSLIAGEGVIARDSDNIGKVGSIFHANLEKSLALQERYGKIRFMPFGLIFWNNLPIIKEPFEDVLGLLLETFGREVEVSELIFSPEILDMSFDKAKRLVVTEKWEGLVLYDSNFVNEYRLDGKDPQRPTGCYKWKPVVEDDFIVREVVWSEKRPGEIKEVILLQIDPKTGREFSCGKFGLFTKSARELIKNVRRPFVIQIEFESRYPSGKIRNGKKFIRIREDKRFKDCIAPKNISPTE